MRRFLIALTMAAALFATDATVRSALACPMCKVANESDENDELAMARPRAYMYSILFMLSMPATLFTGFGITFYRLSRKQQAINEMLMEQSLTDASAADGSVSPEETA